MFDKTVFQTQDFSWQAALNLVLVSNHAYNEKEAIREETTAWGLPHFLFLDNEPTQAFIAADDETVLIGFRGTEGNIHDWLGNLKFLSRETERYGKVHRGFYQGYHNVHDELVAFLDSIDASSKKIWIAGHSLGGALALIAGAELHGRYPIISIHTVGQPRVGNSDFLDYCDFAYGERYIRIVNNRDVVPRVPPGYGHTGKLYWFDAEGELQLVGTTRTNAKGFAPNLPEPAALTEQEFAELQQQLLAETRTRGKVAASLSKLAGVADHDCNKYVDLIKQQRDLINAI